MNNDVIGNLDYYSEKISTQLRTLAIGLLSFSWLFLSNNKDIPAMISNYYKPSFYAISGLALFSILLDFVQLIIAYQNSKTSMNRGHYDPDSKFLVVQTSIFWLKNVPIAIATTWLIIILAAGLA